MESRLLRRTSATFAAFTAAAAFLLLGLERSPAASLFSLQLGSGLAVEGLVVLDQVEADTIDPVGGVDGGLDFGLAAVVSVEEGDGDRGIVLGSAVAHLVERVAESGITALREMTDALRPVAGAVGDGIEASESPDFGGATEAVGRTDTGQVGGSVHIAQTGDGGKMAGGGSQG